MTNRSAVIYWCKSIKGLPWRQRDYLRLQNGILVRYHYPPRARKLRETNLGKFTQKMAKEYATLNGYIFSSQ